LVEFQSATIHSSAKGWAEFLLGDSPPPQNNPETYFRFIQFHINGNDANQLDIESALKGFNTDKAIIIWETQTIGIVIEEKKQKSLSEEELISMSETLESDFYVKISFFIGKLHLFSNQLRAKFLQEKEFFSFGISNLGNPPIFTFERVFPAYLAYYLPVELKQWVNQEILDIFTDDPEMFSTIKLFLENNLNASMTAKKLYIHRNTLQYRIDKFTEKTGIGLKDFYGAFTVFLACLFFEDNRRR
jgi:DNA-binding PucR family transcriptional regulator